MAEHRFSIRCADISTVYDGEMVVWLVSMKDTIFLFFLVELLSNEENNFSWYLQIKLKGPWGFIAYPNSLHAS